jgi:Tfp pilus assembly protein PilF
MTDQIYMQVDPRRDHSFRIPRPDLTAALDVPNACNRCHEDESAQWARQALQDWYGSSPQPHFATIITAGREGRDGAELALVGIADAAEQPAIVRATALSLLASYQLRGSSLAVERGLRDADPLVRIGALRGAQRWPAEQRWRGTRRLLDDELLAVRVETVRGLLSVALALPESVQAQLAPHINDYLEVMTVVADSAEGQSAIAAAHLALGELQAAEAALHTSLEINPQWVPARVNLADLYRGTGRDPLAGEQLRRAVEIAPDMPDVLVAYALWHVRQGQSELSLPLLERAWRLAPGNSRNAYIYVVALNSTGQPERALEVADSTLAQRMDRQLLETAFSIARDAGLQDKMQAYAEALQR